MTFKSSDTTDGSETTKITHKTGWIFGDDKLEKKIQIFDTPGLGAPDLSIDKWVEEVKNGVPKGQQIDMALVVIKSTDKRLGFEQLLSVQAMANFLKGLKAENTFIIFTHCDLQKPKEDFIEKKIKSLEKYCGEDLTIKRDNVILFEKTKESLQNFVDNFVKGKVFFEDDLP
jgi:predicted GTPase